MKRFLATVAIAGSLLGILGAPASADAPAYGKGCEFGQQHAEKATNGHVGGDGHVPGHHRGATYCS